MSNDKINLENFKKILLDDSYIKWLEDFTINNDEFDDLYFVKNNDLATNDKLMIRFLEYFYNEMLVYAIKYLGFKLIEEDNIGCSYNDNVYVVSYDGECYNLIKHKYYKPKFIINYQDLKKQYDIEDNLKANNIKITTLDELIKKVLDRPEDFYRKISESLSSEERIFILKHLKNKSCENCNNSSCTEEYYEKKGLDKSRRHHGKKCADWINHELIGKSKVLKLNNIYDLKK